ncbi:hypothetical protein DAPPUDRAFT_121149 [Daphnia pulex]|uniref:Uncharacterized protein n=1 Tax=Daphnia pulex TaxID=6669 RepID=E9I2T5_DAPPU|nr:hypothetical protein DAPPUDRAFT_121149 [Daphnia pulex]|eukprot:EFX61696.1 hypothetical protein DAPPUDRAFT_121149 [Daphnia pulex]
MRISAEQSFGTFAGKPATWSQAVDFLAAQPELLKKQAQDRWDSEVKGSIELIGYYQTMIEGQPQWQSYQQLADRALPALYDGATPARRFSQDLADVQARGLVALQEIYTQIELNAMNAIHEGLWRDRAALGLGAEEALKIFRAGLNCRIQDLCPLDRVPDPGQPLPGLRLDARPSALWLEWTPDSLVNRALRPGTRLEVVAEYPSLSGPVTGDAVGVAQLRSGQTALQIDLTPILKRAPSGPVCLRLRVDGRAALPLRAGGGAVATDTFQHAAWARSARAASQQAADKLERERAQQNLDRLDVADGEHAAWMQQRGRAGKAAGDSAARLQLSPTAPTQRRKAADWRHGTGQRDGAGLSGRERFIGGRPAGRPAPTSGPEPVPALAQVRRRHRAGRLSPGLTPAIQPFGAGPDQLG